MSNFYEEIYLPKDISNDIDISNELYSKNEENEESDKEGKEANNFLQKKTKPQTKDLTLEETNKMMKFKKDDEESSGEINPELLYYTRNENENEIGKLEFSREVSHHVFKMEKQFEDKNTQTRSSNNEEEE